MGTSLTRVEAGVAVRDEFGAVEQSRSAETAQSAVAARAQAEIQSRYVMAMRWPRSIETFRTKLLQECMRPGFAEEAEYARPVGKEKNDRGEWVEKYATGPTIRLIETALRYFTNMAAEAPVVLEDDSQRIVRCQMTDLETNTFWSQDVVVPKRVEKRGQGKNQEAPKGRQVVGQRINSGGDTTYLVLATDDEIAVKQSALISKAQRKNGERILPSDIIHEALAKSRETIAKGIKEDPAAATRKIIDAFASVNISPDDLVMYLGKKLEHAQPSEIAALRKLYKAISDGEISWGEAVAIRDPQGSKDAQREAADKKLSELRAQHDADKAKAQADGEKLPADTTATTVNPRAEIDAYIKTLGSGRVIEICGEFGAETPDQLEESQIPAVLEALKAALPKTTPTTSVTGKLKLGGNK